jgi:corrinoid protein of di/trimethylamine methyltransferase
MRNNILEKLRLSILEGRAEDAENAAREAIDSGLDPLDAIENGLSKGIREVGQRFERLELFLSDMMASADAMSKAISILEKKMPERSAQFMGNSVVLGTVAGDIHDIGKNIVGCLLKANGFMVNDLGKDIQPKKFVDAAKEKQSRVIGLSALLSTTMVAQQDVITILKDLGLRERHKVIIGGAPTTQEWANEIGADAHGKDANDGIAKVRDLFKEHIGG